MLLCPAYPILREGKDLFNNNYLIEYVKKVMDIRTKMSRRKYAAHEVVALAPFWLVE